MEQIGLRKCSNPFLSYQLSVLDWERLSMAPLKIHTSLRVGNNAQLSERI